MPALLTLGESALASSSQSVTHPKGRRHSRTVAVIFSRIARRVRNAVPICNGRTYRAQVSEVLERNSHSTRIARRNRRRNIASRSIPRAVVAIFSQNCTRRVRDIVAVRTRRTQRRANDAPFTPRKNSPSLVAIAEATSPQIHSPRRCCYIQPEALDVSEIL